MKSVHKLWFVLLRNKKKPHIKHHKYTFMFNRHVKILHTNLQTITVLGTLEDKSVSVRLISRASLVSATWV